MRSLVRGQADNTQVLLELVQVSANQAALEAFYKEKDEQFQKALAELNEGKIIYSIHFNMSNYPLPALTILEQAKGTFKEATSAGELAIDKATPEQIERYKAKKAVSVFVYPAVTLLLIATLGKVLLLIEPRNSSGKISIPRKNRS
jgi:hypothetical protein